ncbi:unnamed protein product [Diatraea saccharalis]|uniref:Protein GDAP2 homolog n=1 Tax=Diatraea saccharalis TaxID=40085 RepID=A0A9N9WHB0_9NEOP|nr:unnamed protein product [Diatraea saccharalis]
MRTPACAGGAAAVTRWSQSTPTHAAHAAATHTPDLDHDNITYPYDDEINQRFAIWHGDISTLEVDAITNSTDETLLECNAVSERILAAAGSELKDEILTRALECRVGEVVVTSGYALSCRVILHTACPAYCPQRPAQATAALHNCYKNVLRRASELSVRSLALCVLNSSECSFPGTAGAHVALRTIRKHLEQHRLPQMVIVWCGSETERSLYTCVAPRYFPLTARDHDRRIRIIHNPHSHHASAEDDASLCDEEAAAEAAAAFARACAPDTQRLLAPPPRAPAIDRRLLDDHDQYERLLRRARTEDLSEISGIGCLYQSGVDRLGRPVVIFIGKWFPIGDIDLDKALLYLIKLLDPIVRGDYVIAYFHTLASAANHPPFSWLKEVYTVLPYKYKKNLKAFYIVHPTFWTKMMTWWFTTFMAPAIKAKVHSLPGVEYLYSVMPRDQLELPAFITEYDMTINGLHYFQPDTNNT